MENIPIPPKDPTPPTPSEDSENEVFSYPASEGVQDDVFLSPFSESFQLKRPPSLQSFGDSTPGSYSPMIPFTPTFQSISGESISENGKPAAPFNFQPMPLSKSPIIKSVGL